MDRIALGRLSIPFSHGPSLTVGNWGEIGGFFGGRVVQHLTQHALGTCSMRRREVTNDQ